MTSANHAFICTSITLFLKLFMNAFQLCWGSIIFLGRTKTAESRRLFLPIQGSVTTSDNIKIHTLFKIMIMICIKNIFALAACH